MAANTDKQKHLSDAKCQMEQQINVARSELKNLRQQIRSLGHVHQKELEKIQDIILKGVVEIAPSEDTPASTGAIKKTLPASSEEASQIMNTTDDIVSVPIIGTVSSWFTEKRGTPRQPGVCKESQGKLTLSKDLFTNPEHTLEGLGSFSHMWLIFYFHKNNATHVRAKVAPPRLNGARVGVFGTRSPHRPAPIGLSLVKIDRVEGATIYFSGVDVVDGTPVLDIKPYIPHYDSPWCLGEGEEEVEDEQSPDDTVSLREAATGSSSDEEQLASHLAALNTSCTAPCTPSKYVPNVREAPDGEEGSTSKSLTPTPKLTALHISPTPSPAETKVRVPSWIDQPPVSKLTVRFSERAVIQLVETGSNTKDMVSAISCVLREDPRSVYLRERWSNHFYTFLIRDLQISCKFDDKARSVTVFQIRSAKKCEVCGEMEWQCMSNGTCSTAVESK